MSELPDKVDWREAVIEAEIARLDRLDFIQRAREATR
jgi:hypothetical protein